MSVKEIKSRLKDSDKRISLIKNPNLENLPEDILYHLGFKSTDNLGEMFGDVKFVCMGGKAERMRTFAYFLKEKLSDVFEGESVADFCGRSNRYSIYKIGPVLSISHGIGVPSLNILLTEIIKLLHYAKVRDPIFIRIGSSGGIGVEPGTVVVTNGAVDELLRPFLEIPVCGKLVRRPSEFNQDLVRELTALSLPDDHFQIKAGKTMCSNDFYEGQGRRDGAFCFFQESDRLEYLQKLQNHGVLNIEMECVCFGAVTHLAGIKAAIVCVTLVNRMEGDQVRISEEMNSNYEIRPQLLVARFIRKFITKF